MNAIKMPIVIGVENLESVKEARTEMQGLQSDLKSLKSINESISLASHAEEYRTLIDVTSQNVNELVGLRERVDRAETTEERELAVNNYQNARNRAITSVRAMNSELGGLMEMMLSFTQDQAKEFTNGIRKIRPQVAHAFNETAKSMASTGTKGTEAITKAFFNSNTFRQLWNPLQQQNPEVFSEANAEKFLKNSFSSMVSKRFVNEYVGWGGEEISIPSTFRGRLPSLFQGLKLERNPQRAALPQNGTRLTQAEATKLENFLKKNTFLADEAEQAGLVRRRNGEIFMNPNATREHVGAFGGNLVALFETGLRGGPGNGIHDLENQTFTEKQHNSLLKKHNMSVDYAVHGAKFLQDNFSWVKPQYTERQTPQIDNTWKNMGSYYSSGRQRSMGVYQIGLNDVTDEGVIHITPDKQLENGTWLPNRGQYATMKYNMLFDRIQNLPASVKQRLNISDFEHNGLNRDIMLINVPTEELENPRTTPERKEEIAQQLTKIITSNPTFGNEEYAFAGTTGTSVAIIRKSIKDVIENGDRESGYVGTPDFFYNGESARNFGKDAKRAFRAYEYASKWSTDVEPTSRIYGTDLSNARVVVADLQDLTGLDGQNLGSKQYFPETFQSRALRDKSTTQVIDFDKYFYNADAPYHNFVDEKTGDIVLPHGGIKGGELRIPKGVALIEDRANIKTKYDLDKMSQEEINDVRTREIQDIGYFIKQSAADYMTPTRFISSQEAATMNLGPQARKYFRDIAFQRLAELEDPDAAKRILFSGNDYLSQLIQQDESFLATQEAQDRIDQEKAYIYSNLGQARLMLPSGAGSYAMLSAWIPNILNDVIGNGNLSEQQKSLALGQDAVAFFESQDKNIQMYRNPSTIAGNIDAINQAASDYMNQVAEWLGLSEQDKKQLFVAPNASDFLKRMQGADLDSDTAFVRMAKQNQPFAQVMAQIMADTGARYQAIQNRGYSPEEYAEIEKQYSSKLDTGDREFGIGPGYELEHMRWFVNSFGKVGGMGAANAVSMYAAQYPLSERVARAIQATNPHYDKASILYQKDVDQWRMTPEEWQIISGGAPLYQMYRWAKDAWRAPDQIEEETAIANGEALPAKIFDYQKFFDRNINAVNFTSVNDTHGLTADMTMWALARRSPDEFQKLNTDWTEIFAHDPTLIQSLADNPDSAVSKYLTEMNQWRSAKANQEFLVAEDELADRLVALEQNAVTEIWSDVDRSGLIGKEAIAEASRRMSEIGIHYNAQTRKATGAAGHLKQWGLTRSNVAANKALRTEIEQLGNIWGTEELFGGAGVAVPELTAKEINVEQTREAAIAKRERAIKIRDEEIAKARQAQEAAQKELDAAQKEAEQQKPQQNVKPAATQQRKPVAATDKNPFEPETDEERLAWEAWHEEHDLEEPLDLDSPPSIQTTQTPPSKFLPWAQKGAVAAFLPNGRVSVKTPDSERQIYIQDASGNWVLESSQPSSIPTAEATPVVQPTVPVPEPTSERYKQAMADIAAADEELAQAGMYERFNAIDLDVSAYAHKLKVDTNKLAGQNDDATFADTYIAKQLGIGFSKINAVRDFFREFGNEEGQVPGLKPELANSLKSSVQSIREDMYRNIVEGSISYSKQLNEDLEKDISKQTGVSKQRETLDNRIERIEGLESWRTNLLKTADAEGVPEKEAIAMRNRAADIKKEIAERQGQLNELEALYTRENEELGRQSLESLQIKHGLRNKNSLTVRSNARMREIEAARGTIEKQYNEGLYSGEEYARMLSGFDQLEKAAKPIRLAAKEMYAPIKNEAKQTYNYLVGMFGRRLMQSAISETTNFVKQYDSAMNTIQMITLKSDEQISKLGDTLIDKAKEMKVSVSEITQSATTLYRQGLSDAEVDDRLEVVSKFSKVSGTKVDAATKLITVAMNTGLVQQAQEASDIVTALGDNAATNAAEIEKGIEKAGAAAAADGTTFAQLASMLTAITSTTQIGGNVAGRTLNTIIGRMNKIGTNELIYDENGNAISGSAVAKLLESEGIRMYDEQGNKRSTYETLYALSQKWDSLSDAKQQQFANAIAGTRQYSNFAAIMTGMSEGKVDEYLALAGESSGITDKKYEIYTKSLNASLTDLRNTWDGLVHDMTDSGALTGALGFFTNFIKGIDEANNSVNGLAGALAGLVPTLALIGGLKTGGPIGWGVAAAGAVGMIVMSLIGGQKSAEEQLQVNLEDIDKQSGTRLENINRAKELKEKGTSRTEAEESEYGRLLNQINVSLSYDDLVKLTDEERTKKLKESEEQIIKDAENNTGSAYIRSLIGQRSNISNVAVSAINKAAKEYQESATGLDIPEMAEAFALGQETPLTGEQLYENLVSSDSGDLFVKMPALLDIVTTNDKINSFLMEKGIERQTLIDAINELAYVPRTESEQESQTASYKALVGLKNSEGQSIMDLIALSGRDAVSQGERESHMLDVVAEQYLPYLKRYGNGLEITDEEYQNMARQAAKDYLSSSKGIEDDDLLADLFYTQIDSIFGLSTSNGDYSAQTRQSNVATYLKQKKLLGKRKQELLDAGLEDVGELGYFIDENGVYYSQEEAIRKNDYYNKNAYKTRYIPEYTLSFDGKEIFRSRDISQRNAELNKKYNDYANLYTATQSYLLNPDALAGLQDLRRGVRQSLANGGNREGVKNYLVEGLKSLGFEIGEGFDDKILDIFNRENLDFRDLFKGGALLNDDVLSLLKSSLANAGIEFNGSLADFLLSSADKMFKFSTEILSETYQDLENPNLKGIRNHFQAQAETTYQTWYNKNTMALNAGSMYRLIQENGLNDIQSLFDYINNNNIGEWDILNTNEDFAKLTHNIIRDSKTGKITAPESLYKNIVEAILGMSSEFSQENLSNIERSARITSSLSNMFDNGYYSSEQALQDAIDKEYNDFVRQTQATYGTMMSRDQYVRQSTWANRLNSYLYDEDRALISGTFGSQISNKLFSNQGLNNFEEWYKNNLLTSMSYGYDGLTKTQQLAGLQMIQEMSIDELKQIQNADFLDRLGYSDISQYIAARVSGVQDTETEQIINTYNKNLEDQAKDLEFNFASERNASKLLQNYTTFLEGTEVERLSTFSPYLEQAKEINNAAYLVQNGANTAADRKAIATLVGLDENRVKELMNNTDGKKQLQDLLNNNVEKLVKEVANSLNVDVKDADWATQLQTKASEAGPEFVNLIQTLLDNVGAYINEAGDLVANATPQPSESISSVADNAMEDVYQQADNAILAGWLPTLISDTRTKLANGEINRQRYASREEFARLNPNIPESEIDNAYKAAQRDKTIGELLQEAAEGNLPEGVSIDSLKTYLSSNKAAWIGGAFSGLIDDDMFAALVQNDLLGTKLTPSENVSLSKLLYNYTDEEGIYHELFDDKGQLKQDVDSIKQFRDRTYELMSDREGGASLVQTWITNMSDVSELLKSLGVPGAEEFKKDVEQVVGAVKELDQGIESANLKEDIEGLKLIDGMDKILEGIAKGGTDASEAVSEYIKKTNTYEDFLVNAAKLPKGKKPYAMRGNKNYKAVAKFLGITDAETKSMTEETFWDKVSQASTESDQLIGDSFIAMLRALGSNKLGVGDIEHNELGQMFLTDAGKKKLGANANLMQQTFDEYNEDLKAGKRIGVFELIANKAGFNLTGNEDIADFWTEDYAKSAEKLQKKIAPQVEKIKEKYASAGLEFDERTITFKEGEITIDERSFSKFSKEAQDTVSTAAKQIEQDINASGVGDVEAGIQLSVAGGGGMSGGKTGQQVNNFWNSPIGQLVGWLFGVNQNGTTDGSDETTQGNGRTGGGGGGMPAWQKKLQEIEHDIKMREHNIKMAQLKQEYYGNTNNYDKQLKWINKEEKAYKSLEKSLKKNIEDLEKEREKASKDSQEYKKLTEAINQYKEKLQETINTRAKLLEKKISVEEEKQEWADTKQTHQRTMIDTYLDRAKTIYERGGTVSQDQAFGDYMSQLQARKQATQDRYNLNLEQITAWEKMLKKAKKNSDQWRTIQQKIWELQEENAQLESEMIDQQIEENEALLAKIVTKLQNMTARSEFYANMAGYDAQKFQMVKGYSQYRTQLGYQRSAYSGQLDMYRTAIAEATAYRDSQAIGSAAWYEADKEVMALTETFSKLQLTIQQTDKAIAESYLTETMDKFDFSDSYLSARGTMAQQQTQRYQMVGAYALMAESMEEEMGVTKLKYDETKAAYDQLSADLAAGKFDSQPEVRDQVMKQLETFGATLSQLSTQIMEQALKIVQTKIQGMESSYESSVGSTLHQIDLTRYQQTRFKNAGELTNYGKALEYELGLQQSVVEPEMAKTLERAKQFYEEQVETYGPSSPEAKAALEFYQKLQKQHEELINEIEDETRALEENKEAVRKVKMEYENTLDKIITAQKEKEKEMLSATVSLQNQLLDSIKERYRSEWSLIKDDIDKKKQALQEEKNLIRERLNAKKEADNAEDLESQRAELQKQLALIEGDATQTKQAKELRERIKELNKQIADLQDERQVKAEEDRIDKQIKAYEDYVEDEDNRINELLENNNNFAEELNRLLNGSFEDYWAEISKDQKYQNMTPEELEQTKQAMQDTWDKMKDIIRTNWDEVKQMIESMDRDSFISWMMEHDEDYRKASDTGKESLKYQYGEMYDNYISSTKDTYTPEEYDATNYGMEEASIETLQDQMKDFYDKFDDYKIFEVPATLASIKDALEDEKKTRKQLIEDAQAAIVKAIEDIPGYKPAQEEEPKPEPEPAAPEPEPVYEQGTDGQGDKGKDDFGATTELIAARDALYNLAKKYDSAKADEYKGYESVSKSVKFLFKLYASKWKEETGKKYKELPDTDKFKDAWDVIRSSDFYKSFSEGTFAFKEGGYVKHTGPAWVDGTPKKPEAFLDYIDTKNIRDLADSLRYVSPFIGAMPALDMIGYGNTSTIGDINITINQAELKQDADYDEVARKIGKAFTRELQKDGFNLANYAF